MENMSHFGPSSVMVGTSCVDVLGPDSSEKYLGRKLRPVNCHEAEIKNRIAAGWGAFMRYKSELCGKHVPFTTKMRLFSAVVTPVVLYATATWTVSEQMARELRVARRRMLRMMFPMRRLKIVPSILDHDSGRDDFSSSDQAAVLMEASI